MNKTDELLEELRRVNHHGLPVSNLLHVLREYRPLANYMLRRFGFKSWYTFWYTKLFVADEGGEYALKNHLYKRFPGLLRKPFKIEIEHTTACNKHCIFCAHTYWNEQKENMSFEKFKHAIDDIPSLRWINLAGIGSNFANKDFARMISYARSKHINVNFVDEFDFFDKDKARLVIDIGINSIFISFDAATKATYEMIKRGCNYDRTIKNIRTLLSLKEEMRSPFPVIHFRYIVTKLNYTEIPEFLELINTFKNRGVRSQVSITGLIAFPGIENHYMPLDSIPDSILIKTYEKALKYKINLNFTHADTQLPSINNCVRWAEPFILVNGDVISDCAILMQTKRADLKAKSFGNIFQTPFTDLWNSKKYRSFRKQVVTKKERVPKSCQNCCAFETNIRIEKYGVSP